MMLRLETTGQFRKDYKRVKKERLLAEKYHDHTLTGNYTGFRGYRVLQDWLLIYTIKQDKLVLTASRTGTYSNLFGE